MTQWTFKARTSALVLFPASTVQFAALIRAASVKTAVMNVSLSVPLAALSRPQFNCSMEKTDGTSHCECSARLQAARNWCQFTPEHPVIPPSAALSLQVRPSLLTPLEIKRFRGTSSVKEDQGEPVMSGGPNSQHHDQDLVLPVLSSVEGRGQLQV